MFGVGNVATFGGSAILLAPVADDARTLDELVAAEHRVEGVLLRCSVREKTVQQHFIVKVLDE